MLSRNAHDGLIQRAFESSADIEGFLLAVLPEPIGRSLRPGSVKLIAPRRTGDDLRSLLPDFLCTAEIEGSEMLVGLILEHQSEPDPVMPLRMLGSAVAVWSQHSRQPAGSAVGTRLPPVLPIVIFHGNRPWPGSTDTLSMVELPAELRDKYVRFQPRSEFLLVDLSTIADERLRGAAMSAFARLALLLLKHGRSDDLLDRLRSLGALLTQLSQAPKGWDAIEVLLRYVMHVAAKTTTEELGEALALSLGNAGREVAMTLAEKLIEEGEKRGLELGEKRGKELGRREALREAAPRLFARGLTPDEIAELLGASSNEVREAIDAAGE